MIIEIVNRDLLLLGIGFFSGIDLVVLIKFVQMIKNY